MLDILRTGEVELHARRRRSPPAGRQYPAGSVVVKLAQPYGAFAKTMLETQVYPDLRLFPGGPPKPPYDVTGHTLWMLMGVKVDQIEQPFEASLERVTHAPPERCADAGAAEVGLPRAGRSRTPAFTDARGCRRRRFPCYRRPRRSTTAAGRIRPGHLDRAADARGHARFSPRYRHDAGSRSRRRTSAVAVDA